MASEKALAVMNAFHRFLQTGDATLITAYSKIDITVTLTEVSPADSHHQWYKAMERRVEELGRLEEKQVEFAERKREKLAERTIGFAFGMAGSILTAWLLRLIF